MAQIGASFGFAVPKDTTAETCAACAWVLAVFYFYIAEKSDSVKLSRYFGSREFCVTALSITVPILLQNLLTSSFSLVDTLMISSLGTVELTAVGLCASWVQLLNVMLFGITSGAGVLVAQFWGGRALGEVRRSYGGGLGLSLGVTGVMLCVTVGFPTTIMGFYSADPEVIAAGTEYLRIVAFGFPAFGLQYTANAVLRSTEQVRTPLYGTITSVVLNICLNYILIFGHFGAPRMGLAGAALASCVANWIGVAVTYSVGLAGGTVLRSRFGELFSFDRVFLKRYLAVALPIMINELLWGGGTAVLNMVYGHMGTVEYAAMTMCNTLENLITTVFLSLGNSANVLVGKEIGGGNREKAYRNALAITCWTPVIAAVFGGLMILLRGPITLIFHQGPEVRGLAMQLILVISCILPLRFIQYIHITGILRAGADGKMAAIYDFIGVWCVSIPLALAGMLLKLPFLWVFFTVSLLDSLVKDILVLRRFFSKKWMIRISK